MSDEPIYDDQGQPVQDPDNDPREWVKNLRKEAKEGKKAAKELEAFKRDKVFSEAGIPEDGPGKLFRKAYDGEVESDAIKAAAQEYGVLQREATPEPTFEEQAAQQRVAQATAGGTAPPPSSLDEELAETDKLPMQQRAEAVRQVMVRNSIWRDQADWE